MAKHFHYIINIIAIVMACIMATAIAIMIIIAIVNNRQYRHLSRCPAPVHPHPQEPPGNGSAGWPLSVPKAKPFHGRCTKFTSLLPTPVTWPMIIPFHAIDFLVHFSPFYHHQCHCAFSSRCVSGGRLALPPALTDAVIEILSFNPTTQTTPKHQPQWGKSHQDLGWNLMFWFWPGHQT